MNDSHSFTRTGTMRFAEWVMILAILLIAASPSHQSSLAFDYCSYFINSTLDDKFRPLRNTSQLGLTVPKTYNPSINLENFHYIYAYKIEHPRLYPLLNCHLKMTPNISRPDWIHDFSYGLTSALKKMPKYELETFRGTGLSSIPKVGDYVTNSGYVSTSKKAHVAAGFAGGQYFLRFVKSGGRDISGLEGLPFAGEEEVIITPGKCFRVVAIGSSQWWSDLKDSIYEFNNTDTTFIELLKVKCPKNNEFTMRSDILSSPSYSELEALQNHLEEFNSKRTLMTVNSVPSEWTCNPSYYNASDGCDCGCGAWDPDCNLKKSLLVGCPSAGAFACSTSSFNCTPIMNNKGYQVPPAWSCSPESYGSNDGCDCGCGAVDPDCASQTVTSFAFGCLDSQYCDATGTCKNKKYVPPTWTCDPSYYNASDGCDCGCGGVLDPDCLDPQQEVLNCPCLTMNCTLGYCTGECLGINIVAMNANDGPKPNPGEHGNIDVQVYYGPGVLAGSIIASFIGGFVVSMLLIALIHHFVNRNNRQKMAKHPGELEQSFVEMGRY
ncbi:hypothetical protein C9374_006219 [Naegleria lovaniensis]|uniref:NAD(P)(+)--arginine ADP-ribosyltransferase n=1 Tax=Naegleria lovaniensis TaxID=51637 RepID=A0AA88GKG2_NAELO|nr:uncharacterized protein C9374_006219 [Naegleria lovaniensis]KAG2381835.1 hypothetical protein C9374_006219 [Naegleria lovaniensis]